MKKPRKKPRPPERKGRVSELDPYQIIRKVDGPKYFGLARTQLDDAIARGEIPQPLQLTDTGRAQGWLGSQIIAHHQKRLAAATKKGAA